MKNVTFQLINQLKLEDRMNIHSSAVRSRCRPTSQIEFSDVRIHGIMALGTHPPPRENDGFPYDTCKISYSRCVETD